MLTAVAITFLKEGVAGNWRCSRGYGYYLLGLGYAEKAKSRESQAERSSAGRTEAVLVTE